MSWRLFLFLLVIVKSRVLELFQSLCPITETSELAHSTNAEPYPAHSVNFLTAIACGSVMTKRLREPSPSQMESVQKCFLGKSALTAYIFLCLRFLLLVSLLLKSLAGKGSCTASSSRQKSSNTDEFSLYDVRILRYGRLCKNPLNELFQDTLFSDK